MPNAKRLDGNGYEAAGTSSTMIAQEAAEWLVAMNDDLEDFDHERFLAWLKTSPQHVREYLLLTAISHKVKALKVG